MIVSKNQLHIRNQRDELPLGIYLNQKNLEKYKKNRRKPYTGRTGNERVNLTYQNNLAFVILLLLYLGLVTPVAMWPPIRRHFVAIQVSWPYGHLFTTDIMLYLFHGHMATYQKLTLSYVYFEAILFKGYQAIGKLIFQIFFSQYHVHYYISFDSPECPLQEYIGLILACSI